jgi:hypothetical protein
MFRELLEDVHGMDLSEVPAAGAGHRLPGVSAADPLSRRSSRR